MGMVIYFRLTKTIQVVTQDNILKTSVSKLALGSREGHED